MSLHSNKEWTLSCTKDEHKSKIHFKLSVFTGILRIKGTNNTERKGADLSLNPSSNTNFIQALGTTDLDQQQICLTQGTTQIPCLNPGADLKKVLGSTAPPLHPWAEQDSEPKPQGGFPAAQGNGATTQKPKMRLYIHVHTPTDTQGKLLSIMLVNYTF